MVESSILWILFDVGTKKAYLLLPTFLEHLEIFQFHKVHWFWHQTSKSNAWKYLVIMKSVKSSGETCVYPDEAPDFLSSKSFFCSEMWYFLSSQLWLKLSWVPETISQPFPTVKTLYYRQICLESCQGTNWAPHTLPSTDQPHCAAGVSTNYIQCFYGSSKFYYLQDGHHRE